MQKHRNCPLCDSDSGELFAEVFGTERDHTVFVHESGVRLESSAGANAGCCALLFALPWAWFDKNRRSWFFCLLMMLEPFLHCWNLHPQPDPKFYYPRLPALEFIQRSSPGRVLGIECLPPKLLESHQLRDIRGYDGVDPLAYVQLLSLSYDPQRTAAPEYARSMWYFPEFREPATQGLSQQRRSARSLDSTTP